MTDQMNNDYYISRKDAVLEDYDQATGAIYAGLLSAYYGEKPANTMIKEIRNEFESLILKMPYVGGDNNIYSGMFFMAVPHLALYKILKAHGKPLVEIGKIVYLTLEIFFDKYPPTYMMFADMDQKELYTMQKNAALESQKRQYPGDWVFDICKPSTDGEYDFGYDEYECGMLKFFEAQGGKEIMPYVCLADFVMSRACGTGLVRNTTLAEGGDRCDFKYKYGRPVTQGWPPMFLKTEDFKIK